jgi:hypothetical protein
MQKMEKKNRQETDHLQRNVIVSNRLSKAIWQLEDSRIITVCLKHIFPEWR